MKAQRRFAKSGSLAFYLSIPVLGAFALLLLLTILDALSNLGSNWENWKYFCYNFALACVWLISFDLLRTKVLIHELKHAVTVLLTGNRLTGIKIAKHSGHVSYQMYMDSLHFVPFILLAPYVFPLFSGPVLIAAIILEPEHLPLMQGLLGFALAVDLTTNVRELHPQQTDLKRIFGGFLPVIFYIMEANLVWILICLLWMIEGREGFVRFGGFALMIIQQIWEHRRNFFSGNFLKRFQ